MLAALPAFDSSDLLSPHPARVCWTGHVGSPDVRPDLHFDRHFVLIESRLRTRRVLSPATRLTLGCLYGASSNGLEKITYSPWGMSAARTSKLSLGES